MTGLRLPRINIRAIAVTLVHGSTFVLLLMSYLLYKFTVQKLCTWTAFGYWHQGKVRNFITASGLKFLRRIDLHEPESISRLDLIDLSIRHLKLKRTRSLITVGGMSVGIAVIVFLVSVGYGLEGLVISRIASLNEMKQAEVTVEPGGKLVLDDKALADFKGISGVADALPQISVIGKIRYNASETDMAAYAVTANYLKESAVAVIQGKLFDSHALSVPASQVSKPIEASTIQMPTDQLADEDDNDTNQPQSIVMSSAALKQAVANRAMLQVLGIKAEEASGKTFEVSFVMNDTDDSGQSILIASLPTSYTIVGVVSDDSSPYFYVPFIDIRSLGVSQYNQVKVTVNQAGDLAAARKHIEVLGYATQSVVDTVAQVNSLFSTFRTILVVLGLGALFVASLGMFNTLTVSLLERTREVGLMKSMGMRSFEVRELFLTESMIMGLFGGLLGVVLGFVGGKMLSLAISVISISQGGGIVDVSSVPIEFALLIILTSIFVGFLTGIYPSRRATRISALNALRYE